MTRLRRPSVIALAMLLCAVFTFSPAAAQVYVQVDIDGDPPPPPPPPRDDAENDEAESGDVEPGERGEEDVSCSILQIDPDGTLTELVSSAEILAATGEAIADCDDTGMASGPDGTLYFGEDVSDHILRRTSDGTVSVYVDQADIAAVIGEARPDNDNGMAVGPDGTLYVADEECDCIYTVSADGSTITLIITEAEVGTVTGNMDDDAVRGDCMGPPEADLEGGLTVAADGTIFFADDGAGCNPDRPSENNRDAILRAVPSGGGGYTLSILFDEDDAFAAFPALFAGCEMEGSFGDYDTDIELGPGGLFVLDDGGCNDDRIYLANIVSGALTLVATAADIGAVTGATDPTDQADLEGGLAIVGSTLVIGDDLSFDSMEDRVLNVRADGGGVLVAVNESEFNDFYEALYGSGPDFDMRGGMVAAGAPILAIPVSGLPGRLALIASLFGAALIVLRRR